MLCWVFIAYPPQSRQLSGGNQQKAVVAKWLGARAKVLIFDEPTRGIDINGKREIYRIHHGRAARKGRWNPNAHFGLYGSHGDVSSHHRIASRADILREAIGGVNNERRLKTQPAF